MNHRCSICSSLYRTSPFKGGHICENCLDTFRSLSVLDKDIDAQNR